MYKIKFAFSVLLTLLFAIVFYIGYTPIINIAEPSLWLYVFCVSIIFSIILFIITYNEKIRFPIYISSSIAALAIILNLIVSM